MSKQVLVINGSPRQHGNSTTLVEKATEGVKSAGPEVEVFNLHGMDIRACDACDTCQETGVCVLMDDMQILYPKLRKADAGSQARSHCQIFHDAASSPPARGQ